MSGHLYQLTSIRKLCAGDFVAVNGPWDKYGSVVKSERKDDGNYLNLIRGRGNAKTGTPVAKF